MLRVGVWNIEWASPVSRTGKAVVARLDAWACDVLVVTEGQRGLLPDAGHVVDSEPDYGYSRVAGRRKVLLWSRRPWSAVDRCGDDGMPSGRFATGVTETPIGQVRVVGVCISWRDAHVRTGRRDRASWEDHQLYLAGLRRWRPALAPDAPDHDRGGLQPARATAWPTAQGR